MMADMALTYDQFRTGLCWSAVLEILWKERELEYAETGHYRGKPSRASVLGKWRAIKVMMYRSYTERLEDYEHVERWAIQHQDEEWGEDRGEGLGSLGSSPWDSYRSSVTSASLDYPLRPSRRSSLRASISGAC